MPRSLAAALCVAAAVAAEVPPEPPRVRALRGDASMPGSAAWLQATAPWTAWMRGRDLFRREYRRRDGAGEPADRVLLGDGRTPELRMGQATSCMLCHNVPFGDPGAGATILKDGPSGRSTPHLFGAGLLEALAASVSAHLLATVDRDGDGTVGPAEAAGARARAPTGDGREIDYGTFADVDGDGRPDLDEAVAWWPVDPAGRRLPGTRIDAANAVGYRFAVRAYGWGGDPPAAARASASLRAFTVGAFAVHAGLQAADGDESADSGRARDAAGLSCDDPDGDGVAAELSAGDIDLIVHYVRNQPPPAERTTMPGFAAGRAHFTAIGCADCHQPDWQPPVAVADPRFATFSVRDGDHGLRGALSVPGPTLGPIRGLYSDLRSHDLGPAFHQLRFDGSVATRFRTPPLWGVATSAPYGHDGASLDLDAVIRRHGGDAMTAAAGYVAMSNAQRGELLGFLSGLVLFPVDGVPLDADGDGAIATGERLAAPWLPLLPDLGRDLPWQRDADGDGFPDLPYAH